MANATLEHTESEIQAPEKVYPNVKILPDIAAKLGMAYYGLPTPRQEVVDAQIREIRISRAQATLNEICNNRIEMYARNGEAEQNKVLEEALHVLINNGLSEEDSRRRLGLGVSA